MAKIESDAEKRKRLTQEKTALLQGYYNAKKDLLHLEEENYSKMYFLKVDGTEYIKLFSHSALIFKYRVSQRVGYSPKLHPDTDYKVVSKEPIVILKENFDSLRERMTEAKFEEIPSDDDRLVIFNLMYKLLPEDIEELRNIDAKRLAQINELLAVKVVLPELKKELRSLTKMSYDTIRRISPPGRAMVGSNFLGTVGKMNRDFVMMANGWGVTLEDYLKNTQQELKEITADMITISDARLVNVDRVFNLSAEINKVRKRVDNLITYYEKRGWKTKPKQDKVAEDSDAQKH